MDTLDIWFGSAMALLFGGAGFHMWKFDRDMHVSAVHAWTRLAPALSTEDLCKQLADSIQRAHNRTESTIIAIIVAELETRGVTYSARHRGGHENTDERPSRGG